jgi:hypothetical protein
VRAIIQKNLVGRARWGPRINAGAVVHFPIEINYLEQKSIPDGSSGLTRAGDTVIKTNE